MFRLLGHTVGLFHYNTRFFLSTSVPNMVLQGDVVDESLFITVGALEHGLAVYAGLAVVGLQSGITS